MKLIGYPPPAVQAIRAYLDRQPRGEVAHLIAMLDAGTPIDITTNEELAAAQAMQQAAEAAKA